MEVVCSRGDDPQPGSMAGEAISQLASVEIGLDCITLVALGYQSSVSQFGSSQTPSAFSI